jgi:hypothetical protein
MIRVLFSLWEYPTAFFSTNRYQWSTLQTPLVNELSAAAAGTESGVLCLSFKFPPARRLIGIAWLVLRLVADVAHVLHALVWCHQEASLRVH